MKVLLQFGPVGLLLMVAAAQRDLSVAPTESGGVLLAEQAAYDVRSYDLAVEVDFDERSISGSVIVKADIVHPTEWLVLDLDSPLAVDSVRRGGVRGLSFERRGDRLSFERRGGRLWIEMPTMQQPGDEVSVRVDYSGRPRVAARPPWVGGLVWDQTADGRPWLGVACQQDGADLWWPVKDHSSDEPDRVDLHFRVPAGLTAVSNGRLIRIEDHPGGDRTFHWRVSNPINAYNVTLNVAPYEELRSRFRSRSGQDVDFHFWVLPEDRAKAEPLVSHFIDQIHFLEELLGPYPFGNEKFGVVQTSYLGMEHQTAISYGAGFQLNEFGFETIQFHELAHEWWGNLVTVADWRDYWIHEGFASYMEPLYAERLGGARALHDYMGRIRSRLRNRMAVAPTESMSTRQKYFVAPDYTRSDGDVNHKGSWILHTLRWRVGDDAFFRALRRFAYPDGPAAPGDGCACRFAGTRDFQRTIEREAGADLGWFFDVYLRQPALPALVTQQRGDTLELRWQTPDGQPFPMPIEVEIGEERRRIEMPQGAARIHTGGLPVTVDPDQWVLRAPAP